MESAETLDPTLAKAIARFLEGSVTNTAELLQVKRDLGRTRVAEKLARDRRAAKNTPLQTGGVLTVRDGREMVVHKAEDELAKARRAVEAADLRHYNARKRFFYEVAKKAGYWRLTGKLKPAYVVTSDREGRVLRRF
ncbi:hypothetical protein F4777DRAFT_580160 [Nemania sp. FL0916]|nr:hypothetical protein F4777DRAFT_580160 [Nemania sp. FL0916]